MKNSIKRAIITKGGKDDTNRPIQQVEYLERISEAEIIFPYGVHANLPKDCLLTVFTVLGNSSNEVAIGGLPNERIQVEEGEVVFFHPLTKAKIHFKKDGNIEIDALEKDINITCNNASITAKNDVNLTAENDVNLTASGVMNVDVPTTNWTGDIIQSGTLENDQTTSNGIDLDGHVHSPGSFIVTHSGAHPVTGTSGASE